MVDATVTETSAVPRTGGRAKPAKSQGRDGCVTREKVPPEAQADRHGARSVSPKRRDGKTQGYQSGRHGYARFIAGPASGADLAVKAAPPGAATVVTFSLTSGTAHTVPR